jgi:hypothetical protein
MGINGPFLVQGQVSQELGRSNLILISTYYGIGIVWKARSSFTHDGLMMCGIILFSCGVQDRSKG